MLWEYMRLNETLQDYVWKFFLYIRGFCVTHGTLWDGIAPNDGAGRET